ncbi:hypothetical protein HYW36_01810 [Candidatus Saccharibacteria bacterium]|nr:hypothetical protein [Candidatus Saccharibacteria bacterium]
MIQKLKIALLSLSLIFTLSFTSLTPTVGAANIQGNLCKGANQLTVDTGEAASCATETAETAPCDFNCVLRKIVNLVSIIVGVVAVIMIIVGGFRYITSGGKEEGVKNAKNTILYGLIGLIIVALAQVIVRFVLNKATTT